MRERAHKKEYVAKQQRWLLFLRHCAKCQAPEGQCTYGDSCTTAKELWRHILTCADPHCQYPRSAGLFLHFDSTHFFIEYHGTQHLSHGLVSIPY